MPKVEGHNEWSLQKNGLDCIVGLVAGWVVGGALAQEVCNTPECQIAGMDILYVQEVVTQSKLLYKMGHYFLDTQ